MLAPEIAVTGDGESHDVAPVLSNAQPKEADIEMTEAELAPTAGAADHIDQIRDILFGRQKAETNARFDQLEQRVALEIGALRAELNERVDTLDAYVREETANLGRRIDAERRERTESMADAAVSVRARGDALIRRIDTLQESGDTEARALRQQVLDEASRAQTALREQANAIKAEIDAHVNRLGDQKTDRHALAGLLSEVAARLSSGD